MSRDHIKLIRMFRIIRLLNTKRTGISVKDIAKTVNMSVRSIFRYLESFREIGMHLERYETDSEILYKVKKVSTELSEALDFLPELPSSKHILLPDPVIHKAKASVWIVEDLFADEFFTFDTLPALMHYFPVIRKQKIYESLLISNSVLSDNGQYKIIKSGLYKHKSL